MEIGSGVTGAPRGSVAHWLDEARWIIERAHEEKLRNRPLPPRLAALVQHLLNPVESDTGPKIKRPAIVEVTSAEYAKRTGYSQRHIRRLARAGKLTARRDGHDWLITTEGAHDGESDRTGAEPR